MNDKLLGLIYIIIGILIIAVMLWVGTWFYIYLIWIIAIVLIIAGIYFLFFKRR